MKNKKYRLAVLVLTLMVVIFLFSISCANRPGVISELTIAKGVDADGRPVDPTNIFSPDTSAIYTYFKISGFPVGTKIEVDWIYVGGDPKIEFLIGKNYVATKQTATVTKTGSGYTNTTFSPTGMGFEEWPKGDYKIVVYVEGVEKASTTFQIQ